MKWKINDEWTVRSDKYNLILERTVLSTKENAKNKYVTITEGYFPSMEAVYRKMVNCYVLDNPSILGNLKTMVDLMDRLASDIAAKYPKKKMS